MKYASLGLPWFFLLSIAACGSGATDAAGGAGGAGGRAPYPDPDPLPALTMAPLTTDVRVLPVMPQGTSALDPRAPADIETLLTNGFGAETSAPGEPVQFVTFDGSPPAATGPNAKLLTRFVHLSDTQLADDESPTRVCQLDSPQGPTDAAFRPQEGHECNILDAAVRTINKVNETEKLDFVVLGGDNSDNAQTNEVDWFSSILDGSKRVECDSGADDDPVPGPMNDPKDPFFAEGLRGIPWYWVSGNHDVLSQGNFDVTHMTPDYVGTFSNAGTRDWSHAGGPILAGEGIVADPARAPLIGPALLTRVMSHGDGHGITPDTVAYGRAYYTFEASPTVRFLVVDSTAPTGSADGLITQTDVDQKVKPYLDKALADGKIVVVTSHHSSSKLTDGGGFGGTPHADALTPDAWRNLLGSYPNVIMHLAGHTHHHKVIPVTPPVGHPYWELETAALADWPFEMRVIEIWDLDNGTIGIKSIALDYSVEGDPIAADGRKRAVADFTSGWSKNGAGLPTDRNVELVIPKP